ncbi:MAG: ribosome maturation factor RimP [Bacillota bacterium]|nr:ribosome maturation factor RimP [Bacillota bacterium]
MNEESKVKSLIEAPLSELGYSVVSVIYHPNSKDGPKLEVTIDRDEPISLNQIVEVSEKISAILDEDDPFPGAYTLDVSSLGAEKPVAVDKLPSYIGSYLNLHLSHPYKGENILEGELVAIKDGTLTLKLKLKGRAKDIEIPLKDVDRARLAIKF